MKDKVSKFLIIGVISLFLGLSTVSCSFLGETFQDKVVTTTDNVNEEALPTAVPADLGLVQSKLPADVKARLEAEGKTLVIVDKNDVKDPTQAVDLTAPGEGTLGTVLDVGLGIARTVFPGVAVLEGLGLLFSQRKRQHYAAAVQAIAPTDGNVEVGEALKSVVRAMGLAHSSGESKAAFEGKAAS